MEANKILNADVLDIIFEGRNKNMALMISEKTTTKHWGRH
jgi:hypothetical protein